MKEQAPVRIGKISSINYEAGTARVLYTDRDNAVTQELPFLSMEYNMPNINDQVLVLHLSKGEEAGFIIGKVYHKNNIPINPGKNIFRKELSKIPKKAYIEYDEETETLKIIAPHIKIEEVPFEQEDVE